MSFPSNVEDWRRWRRGLPRAEFISHFRHPFFVRRPQPSRGEARVSFDTGVADPVEPGATPARAPAGRLDGARILPVTKAPGNPFPERISLGRAQNCDVVVREASVSKLHAHMRVDGPGETFLTDNRSSNGTRVNGRPVAPGEAQRLVSGDMVLVGAVALQFLEADELWDLL